MCSKIVYLFGNYMISAKMAKNIGLELDNIETTTFVYSARYQREGVTKNLKKLTTRSLEKINL